MGLAALCIFVSLVLGNFYPRIQVIDVDLVIGNRHRNALAGVLRRRAVAMAVARDANTMATINDKDANIQRTEDLDQTAKKLAFFILKHLPAGV